jgi:hypothetical protein
MPGYAGDGDAPALQMQKEEDVIRHETAPGQNLDREEVRAG